MQIIHWYRLKLWLFWAVCHCCLLPACLSDLSTLSVFPRVNVQRPSCWVALGLIWFLAAAGIRDSGRSGHTLTWPSPRYPDEWSQKPGPPAPAGNGGSPGASHSPSPTPAWLWPSASCKTEVKMEIWHAHTAPHNVNQTSVTCCGNGKPLWCPLLLWRHWWEEEWPSQSQDPRPPPRPLSESPGRRNKNVSSLLPSHEARWYLLLYYKFWCVGGGA